MQKSVRIAVALAFAAVVGIAAQDNPLIGTWQFNPSKSNLTGDTLAFKQVNQGEMELTANGQSYRFKLDGSQVPAPFGYQAAWTKTGDNTWQTVFTFEGKRIGTDAYSLSPDGKTLTITSTNTRPNGQTVEEKEVYQRTGEAAVPTGTSGASEPGGRLAGDWKATTYSNPSPGAISFEANGSDGLTFKRLQWDQAVSGKFDGKEYPFTGPNVPPNTTAVMKMVGAGSVEITFKQGDKVMLTNTYTASQDGQTLTVKERSPGQDQANTIVFDRK